MNKKTQNQQEISEKKIGGYKTWKKEARENRLTVGGLKTAIKNNNCVNYVNFLIYRIFITSLLTPSTNFVGRILR